LSWSVAASWTSVISRCFGKDDRKAFFLMFAKPGAHGEAM
jgi:hypothetical protein